MKSSQMMIVATFQSVSHALHQKTFQLFGHWRRRMHNPEKKSWYQALLSNYSQLCTSNKTHEIWKYTHHSNLFWVLRLLLLYGQFRVKKIFLVFSIFMKKDNKMIWLSLQRLTYFQDKEGGNMVSRSENLSDHICITIHKTLTFVMLNTIWMKNLF